MAAHPRNAPIGLIVVIRPKNVRVNLFPGYVCFMKPLNIRCLRGLKAVGIEIADKLPRSVAKSSRRRSGFRLRGQKAGMVRSLIVNKILSFQYHLGRLIGRKRAGRICVLIERGFTNVFGREVYCDEK